MNRFLRRLVVFAFTSLAFLSANTQTSFKAKDEVPDGWHLKDKAKDGLYGISMDQAYQYVKGKKGKTVIVAVLDTGIDTTHEDLKPVLWTNPKEIPGNGKDDDKNGYVDDVHGWNFIGGKDGRNVGDDSFEAARIYHRLKGKYENADETKLSRAEKVEYETWLRAKEDVMKDVDPTMMDYLKAIEVNIRKGDSIVRKELGKEEYSCADLDKYSSASIDAIKLKLTMMALCRGNNSMDITNQDILDDLASEIKKIESVNTPPRDYRGEIVKDNYNDINDKYYGNNDIMGSFGLHGTHVSGTIAAVRNNKIGMDGVADDVKIMFVRMLPDGDEHDKDVALAIRYAVDNGAQVINMSFGKYYSPEKQWVDDAVQYAQSKGVLLVSAAGNEKFDADSMVHYPSKIFNNGKMTTNWITVGASSDPKQGGLVAGFSNYGKKDVDVFAPGENIYSTVPGGNKYRNLSGTSMASPVVTGLAAFIISYFPELSAEQVKYVIESSVVKPDVKAKKPGTGEEVELSDLSKTGGIVNAFEAVKLASTLKGERYNNKNLKAF